MTVEIGPGTAVLVVDVQQGVAGPAWRADEVIGRIAAVVERARAAGCPVIWVRHSDESLAENSVGWGIVPELVPAATEPIIDKHFGDAFEQTDLGEVLTRLRVRQVVVCGMQTDGCVLVTLFGGFVRGYDMTLIQDAHTTNDRSEFGVPIPVADIIAEVNFIWAHRSAPGRRAAVASAANIVFPPG
jgi:nicotinamidase-related amidase